MADGVFVQVANRGPSDLVAWSPSPLTKVHERANFDYRLTPAPVGGSTKRGLDAIAACALLIVLAPILLLIAVLVRLDSPGPALFRQSRTGFRGRSFSIYKFRTMSDHSHGDRALHQAVKQDARVTRLGGFLRRSSIDELPQLLNVLVGDMSLVGPRPHAVSHDHKFATIEAGYARRFAARPGITGLAQVSGCRGESETPEKITKRVVKDLEYVDNWSLGRDISILTATVGVVFHARNAY